MVISCRPLISSKALSESEDAIFPPKMSSRFNLEIVREVEARRESRADLDKKLEVLKVLDQRVKDFDGTANVFAFGSCMTGFVLCALKVHLATNGEPSLGGDTGSG